MLELIHQQRQSAIVEMVDVALFYYNRYLGKGISKPICCHPTAPTYDCDLVILGSITKEYQSRIGLFPRPPNQDHPNYDKFLLMSISEVEQILQSITIRFLGGGHACTCGFLSELLTKIACVVTKVEGLQLESFNSRRRLKVVSPS